MQGDKPVHAIILGKAEKSVLFQNRIQGKSLIQHNVIYCMHLMFITIV